MYELEATWKYYQLAFNDDPNQRSWADSLKEVGAVKTVPELLYTLDEMKKKGLENLTDLNLFKNEIKPMWEDAANINGGRCIMDLPVTQRDNVFDIWRKTVAFCCSNGFESICGCVFAEKANFRISLWISDPQESDNIIKAWKEVLESSQCNPSFSPHSKYLDNGRSKKRPFKNR